MTENQSQVQQQTSTSTTNDIPTSARDILLAKVGEFIIQATQKRASDENEDALSLYQRASEILYALVNSMFYDMYAIFF